LCVPGIVIAASRTRSKANRLAIQCKTCRSVKYMHLGGGFGGCNIPRICDQASANPETSTEGGCGLDPYQVDLERSKFMDQQVLKMQVRVFVSGFPKSTDTVYPTPCFTSTAVE
jgi:DNA replication licensing factor MCM5